MAPKRWRAGPVWRTCFPSAYVTGRPASPKRGKTTPPTPTTTSPPPVAHDRCFTSPGACGYPDPGYHNVGASTACSSLESSGPITTSRDGQTIENTAVNGEIIVQNNNVTINNVCVQDNGGEAAGSVGISIMRGEDTTIENSTIAGLDTTGRSLDWAVANSSGNGATLAHDYIYNCGECIHSGPWTIDGSYAIANGMEGSDEHIETIYCDSGNGYTGSINANHDTLLAPNEPGGVAPVAVLFCDTNDGSGGACGNQVSITNSLLAGGAYLLYTCGNSSSVGTSSITIVGNRFARCTSGSCPDAMGYWHDGGEYGIASDTYCPPDARQTWSSNVWDNSGSSVVC